MRIRIVQRSTHTWEKETYNLLQIFLEVIRQACMKSAVQATSFKGLIVFQQTLLGH
jgi:hypothetical protein